jgi:hypothetical protein
MEIRGGHYVKKQIHKLMVILLQLAGTLLSIYVGGYWLLFRPVQFLYTGFVAGTLTSHELIICIVKIFLASTVAGGIWSIFDIMAGCFRDDRE